jgi:hypothetical protein
MHGTKFSQNQGTEEVIKVYKHKHTPKEREREKKTPNE